jgi:hypothetical protein
MSDFFPRLTRRATYTGTAGVYGYRRYRAEVSEDCQYRCVYCDSHHSDIGGEPMMEMDHFRPESKFGHLADDPLNLVYACRSCNRLKGYDWPAGNASECYCGEEGYLDPFQDDRTQFFSVTNLGEIVPLKAPARYIERRLGLNRPLLKRLRLRALMVRESRKLLDELTVELEERLAQQPASPDAGLLRKCVAAFRIQLDLLNFMMAHSASPVINQTN